MKRIIFLIVVCIPVLSSLCFAEEQFRSEDWHFTFMVPEGWELITEIPLIVDFVETIDEVDLSGGGEEILALCRPYEGRNDEYILIWCWQISDNPDAGGGIIVEQIYRDNFRSNGARSFRISEMISLRKELIEQGVIKSKPKPFYRYFTPKQSNILYDAFVAPHVDGSTMVLSKIKVLGYNRIVAINSKTYIDDVDSHSEYIELIGESVTFDKNYGFGEVPAFDIAKTLWHWVFPGIGTCIVIFLIYRWVNS